MDDKKFSVSVKINSNSATHIFFSIYVKMIPTDGDHEKYNRAYTGCTLCMQPQEFTEFIKRLRPHVISNVTENIIQLLPESQYGKVVFNHYSLIEENE